MYKSQQGIARQDVQPPCAVPAWSAGRAFAVAGMRCTRSTVPLDDAEASSVPSWFHARATCTRRGRTHDRVN